MVSIVHSDFDWFCTIVVSRWPPSSNNFNKLQKKFEVYFITKTLYEDTNNRPQDQAKCAKRIKEFGQRWKKEFSLVKGAYEMIEGFVFIQE